MSYSRRVLIVEENSYVPLDNRVWHEALTLRDAGWQTTIICPAARGYNGSKKAPEVIGAVENTDGMNVYRFPLNYAGASMKSYVSEYVTALISITRLSWRAWRNEHFDIIHICNPPDIFFPIGLFYRLLGARFVFDHHDLFPELVAWRYSGLAGRLLYAVARLTEYLTFRCANAIISTNQSYRQIAMRRGGVSEDRIVILRNGPISDEFVPVEPHPELKRDLPYMACFAGAMNYEDGVLELLASIRHIVHDMDRRDILFTFLGDGAIRPQALAQVKAWGLETVVNMPGMIYDNLVLRQYLSTADVCLSPEPLTPLNAHSTFIKVGEYMAIGRPIVAYDLPETRYTAQEAAIYVTPGEIEEYGKAIVTLLANPVQRQFMGEYGRQRILKDLSWDHQQENLFRAYAVALA
jgi:glycosyltransferase involved in cell wall biosynthesis